MNENEQTCVCIGEVGQGGSKKAVAKGTSAPKIGAGKGAYAKMAAKKLRESYIFPEPVKDACWIPLSKGKFALVDAADFEKVNAKTWTVLVSKTVSYALFREQATKRTVFLHRWIMDVSDESMLVDHINFNGLDCRKQNMRVCSKSENNRHSRKWRTPTYSKFKGVSFDSRYRAKWSAQLHTGGKKIYLGRFQTEELAAQTYDSAAKLHFGEFARLNFP